ncbi:MAG: molybdopterin-binding protein [Thermoflexales bacterium]
MTDASTTMAASPVPPSLNRTVEIFAIGNELLVGQVIDTNSHWLIRQITALGAQVRRGMILRDEYDEIEDAFRNALRRRPRLIITTGGLGPTDDDMTFRAIARAYKLEQYEHPAALEMVRKRYEYIATIRPGYSADLNESRRKMAFFPVGAEPLFNPNGAAPGLVMDLPAGEGEITTLVSLPGVPSEMKDIFTTSMQAVLAATIGAGGHVERTIVLDRGDESRIADLLRQLQADHPTVYVKSRGQKLDDGLRLTVVLACGGENLATVRADNEAAEKDAVAGLEGLGYSILRVVEG